MVDIPAYVLLGHETALRRRMDIVANNLANLSTTAFKREQPVFEEALRRSDSREPAARSVSFVLDFGAVHDQTEGAFTATGNPLDVAIAGPGFLSVALPDGSTGYTRAGGLKLLADGRLGSAAGLPILGDNGQPIAVPAEAQGGLKIAADGTVEGPDGPLGRIGITRFPNEATLSQRGDGIMVGSGGTPVPAAEVRLHTGGLEASNVQPIAETTAMIEVMRAYQTSQRMGEALGDLRKNAIGRLGAFRN